MAFLIGELLKLPPRKPPSKAGTGNSAPIIVEPVALAKFYIKSVECKHKRKQKTQ